MPTIKDVVITPEMEARLRRFSPVRIDGTFEYIPIAYRDMPDAIRPVFVLRELSGTEAVETGDAMRGEVELDGSASAKRINIKQGAYTLAVCRKGIRGWRNYFDLSSGKEIAFDKELGAVPRDLLYELCNAILTHSTLKEEEIVGLK